MKKRIVSMCLSVCMLASLFTGYFATTSASASAETNVNKILLDNLLSDRSWVIDTLINDDYSTNPHAIVNGVSGQKSMMATALSQYENKDDPNYSAAYKIMVDALTLWYNKGDYAADVVDGVTEWSADALEAFGTAEGAQNALRNCADSAKNMQYDNILQEVIKADYTSTSGKTLSGSNSQLVQLRKISDGATALKNLASAAKDVSGLDYETALSTTDYINTVLNPASDSYEKAISSLGKAMGAESGEEETALLEFSKFLGRVMVYDSIVISPSGSGKVATLAPTYLLDETTKEIIDVNSNIADFASTTIDGYMYIKSIQTQKESVAGVMTRAASNTSNTGTKTVLNRYADLIEDAADGKTANYKYVISTLRQSGVLNKYVEKKTSEAVKDVVKRLIPCYESSIAPDVFASVTGVVGTATYLADAVTGLKDTCTKTVELKNLNEIINLFVKTYKQDLANYKSNPTDENAAKVIDDLEFIQRLRLRGETIAYGMTRAQFSSLLGKLLSGGVASSEDGLTMIYQANMDSIIGASVTPFTTDSFTVKSGETVSIVTHDKGFLYGMSKSENGTPVLFAEPEYRMMNGVTVQSGGTLNVAVQRVATPHIVNNGGIVVLGCNNLNEFTQTGGTLTLGVNVNAIKEVYLSGGTIESSSSATLNCDVFSLSGKVDVSNLNIITERGDILSTWDLGDNSLTINEESNISGTISGGAVNIKGDSIGGGGTIENLYISGSGNQTLSGTLNATNLVYNNTGTVNQTGTTYVSGTVKNSSSKVTNGQNTVLKSTGNIIGNHYNSGLALDGVMLDKSMTFGGTLKTLNTVNLDDVIITGGLTQSSGTLNFNGDVTVSGDSYFAGTVNQNENSYYAGGDISVNGTNTFNNIVTTGKVLQTISGKVNVNNFTNNNSKGIRIDNTVSVSGILTNKYGQITGMGMTLLSGGSFNSDIYYGDVTIQSDNCNFPQKITGNVKLTAKNTLDRNIQIDGYLNFSSGTLTLDSYSLNVGKSLTNSGTLLGMESNVTVGGIVQNSGTITGCNLNLKKELVNTGTVSESNISTISDIYNNGSLNPNILTLNAIASIEVSGNTISTVDLNIDGNGKIILNTDINVTGKYNNSGTLIEGDGVKLLSANTISQDITYNHLNSKADLIIDGCKVITDTLNITAGLKLVNGATLIVNKKAIASGSSKTIEIDETSQITINKIANITSYSDIIINGIITFGGDSVVNSTMFSGKGTINIKGDLYGTSLTINKPENVYIIGKTPQIISISGGRNFINLNIINPSRSGVEFINPVYYYGEYNPNGSNVSGTIIEEQEVK